jgi:hypothetical protein
MIVYNTTFTFHNSLREELISWLRNQWLPEAKAAGLIDSMVAKLMVEIDPSAMAFAVQGKFQSEADAHQWHDGRGAELLAHLHSIYGENILPFTTYMEVLDL